MPVPRRLEQSLWLEEAAHRGEGLGKLLRWRIHRLEVARALQGDELGLAARGLDVALAHLEGDPVGPRCRWTRICCMLSGNSFIGDPSAWCSGAMKRAAPLVGPAGALPCRGMSNTGASARTGRVAVLCRRTWKSRPAREWSMTPSGRRARTAGGRGTRARARGPRRGRATRRREHPLSGTRGSSSRGLPRSAPRRGGPCGSRCRSPASSRRAAPAQAGTGRHRPERAGRRTGAVLARTRGARWQLPAVGR